MTVLITGGAGYIGSHAILAFRAAGYDVVVVDNLVTGHRNAVPTDVMFIECNAGDMERVRAVVEAHGITSVGRMKTAVDCLKTLAQYNRSIAEQRDAVHRGESPARLARR